MQRYNFFKWLMQRNKPFFQFAYDFYKAKGKSKNYERTRLSLLKACEHTQCIVFFRDITKTNIVKMNNIFLKNDFSYNYMKGLHSSMNACISAAISAGYLKKNPYHDLNLKKGHASENNLFITRQSLQKVEQTKYKHPGTRFSADLIIFQCHTGLAYSDLMASTYDEIQSFGDEKWLIGSRKKTKVRYYVPLDETALQIIEKYRNPCKRRSKISDKHIFPYIPLVTYNRVLKSIGQFAGIPEVLKSHGRRHTFASLKLEDGISIESIKKMIGHSAKSDVTWLYAQVTMQKIKKEMSGKNNFFTIF